MRRGSRTLREASSSPARLDPATWFLSADERGNPDTNLDARHPGSLAWTTGNAVRPLVHGATYFAELLMAVRAAQRGDLLLFTDWRGDPDELLDGPGTEIGHILAEAAARGVEVRGLLWRSHYDSQFSAAENRRLGQDVEDAGGQALLDMRVRVFGSHHQKLVVLRRRDRPEDDVAFVGGIDLCHSRRDDERHLGDEQAIEMASVYGPRPPWHDVQVALRGPAVGDVETTFRERWDDPAPLTWHPFRRLGVLLHREEPSARPLPPPTPDPPPQGDVAVQILRTYPARRPRYPYARHGERSIARAYVKALARARSLVYVEDQYLWSPDVARVYARALRHSADLRIVFVIPLHPDLDGALTLAPNYVGRERALRLLHDAGGDRVAVYGLENEQGTPIYVHAKVCVVDDTWACVGSDNANRRSWSHDSELSAAMMDGRSDGLARRLRVGLAHEHLADAAAGRNLEDAVGWFDAFRDAAHALQAWHDGGRHGPRPPGRLRPYIQPPLSPLTRAWAELLYRRVYDPDGRPRALRRRQAF